MILRLLSAALAAGFLAAIVATGLELSLTSPLIVAAERYETPAPGQAAQGTTRALPIVLAHSGHDHAAPDAAPDWQPAPGFQRMAFTGLATLVGGVGWALILGAVLIALGREPTLQTASPSRWPASPACPSPRHSACRRNCRDRRRRRSSPGRHGG